MPSAGRDRDARSRFIADIDGSLEAAGLGFDAPIGVALSGGPDSSALLILAATACAGRVSALTVDHGLRPEAAAEAQGAAHLCDTLDVPHEILGVTLDGGSVQAAARTARYRALGAWATQHGLAAVLTAHHADDQAETVLMRLARGAGLSGLSGIRRVQRFDDGLLVLRPLLSWRKAELEVVCAEAGIVPARDPSNADPRYDRTRARALLAATDWLDAARLAASADHLAEAEAALAALADERYAVERDGDKVRLRPDPHAEIARRHLRRLLAEEFCAAPDGPSLDLALRLLRHGADTTCAGILCHTGATVWTFRRAPPHRTI